MLNLSENQPTHLQAIEKGGKKMQCVKKIHNAIVQMKCNV